MDELITITLSEYQQLRKDSDFLNCLDACGVDNWQPGYSDAWTMMNEGDE
jgi:hypothetical protein